MHVLFFKNDLQKLIKRFRHMHLDESELFIALVSQDFAKKSNLMILFGVLFYPINDACRLLYDQIL